MKNLKMFLAWLFVVMALTACQTPNSLGEDTSNSSSSSSDSTFVSYSKIAAGLEIKYSDADALVKIKAPDAWKSWKYLVKDSNTTSIPASAISEASNYDSKSGITQVAKGSNIFFFAGSDKDNLARIPGRFTAVDTGAMSPKVTFNGNLVGQGNETENKVSAQGLTATLFASSDTIGTNGVVGSGITLRYGFDLASYPTSANAATLGTAYSATTGIVTPALADANTPQTFWLVVWVLRGAALIDTYNYTESQVTVSPSIAGQSAPPTISFADGQNAAYVRNGGSTQWFASAPAGAVGTIRYTISTDGTDPVDPGTTGTVYSSGPFVSQTTKIKMNFLANGDTKPSLTQSWTVQFANTNQPIVYINGAVVNSGTTSSLASNSYLISIDPKGSPDVYWNWSSLGGLSDPRQNDGISTKWDGTAFNKTGNGILKVVGLVNGVYSNTFVVTLNVTQQTKLTTPVLTIGTVSNGTATATMSSSVSGATIRYTIDGSTPTSSSAQYFTSFSVAAGATVKAIAQMSGYVDSDVASATVGSNPVVSSGYVKTSSAYAGMTVVAWIGSVKTIKTITSTGNTGIYVSSSQGTQDFHVEDTVSNNGKYIYMTGFYIADGHSAGSQIDWVGKRWRDWDSNSGTNDIQRSNPLPLNIVATATE